MQTGAITNYIDVAQVTLYVFWLFFAGLVFYLRSEDKREGYPLVSDLPEEQGIVGYPSLPSPKTFLLPHGGTTVAPRLEAPETFAAVPSAPWPGAPLMPTGNPMIDGVGAAAYALRSDEPDLGWEDHKPKIVPLRTAREYSLATEDPELIGYTVVGADGVVAGAIVDAWIDRSEAMLRYVEVALTAPLPARTVLMPVGFADISRKRREVRVFALLGAQFADVPGLRQPDRVSLREEDRISAYYAGGLLYATPERSEPFV